jgi:hypothetical protein
MSKSYNRDTYSNDGYSNDYKSLPPIKQTRYSEALNQQQNNHDDSRHSSVAGSKRGTEGTGQQRETIGDYGYVHDVDGDLSNGRPIQLVQANHKTGQFILNEPEVAEHFDLKGNVAFVTIAGNYRTGKSFMLNKLLGLQGRGFEVDSSTSSCTQGIWMWSVPLYVEKDDLYIFFLDTEGSRSTEKTTNHDAKIFALACLLSNYFIYNSVGAIDDRSINELSLATQLSKNISISAEDNTEKVLSQFTPKFMWILRDFTLEIRDAKDKVITANQYLENALTDMSTYNKTSETNRKIRQAMLNFFKDRECITFVRPVGEEKELKVLNSLPDNKIRPEFTNQVNVLREKILSKTTCKQLKGVNLNFRMFIAMVGKFLDSINSGGVPTISTAWEHLVDSECREAKERAKELYEAAIAHNLSNENHPKTLEDLHTILKNVRDASIEKYNIMTAKLDKTEYVTIYKDELKDSFDQTEQKIFEINENLAQAHNVELLRDISTNIKLDVTSGTYSRENAHVFVQDFFNFLEKYNAESTGLTKNRSLIDFLKHFHSEAITSIMKTIEQGFIKNDQTLAHEKERVVESESHLKQSLAVLQGKSGTTGEQLSKLKEQRNNLKKQYDDLSGKISKMKDDDEKKLKQFETDINKDKKENLEKKEKEIEEIELKIKEAEAKLAKLKKGCCSIF